MILEHDVVIRKRGEEARQHLLVLGKAAGAGAEGRGFQQHVLMKNGQRRRHVLPALCNRQCLSQFEHSIAVHEVPPCRKPLSAGAERVG
jgi:hypothetical protein